MFSSFVFFNKAFARNSGRHKEVIIHAGLNKTGTSSIQQTCFANRKLLIRQGVLFPGCWKPNHSLPLYSAFCDHPEKFHINVREGLTLQEIRERDKKFLKELEAEITKIEWNKLILSGEAVSLLTKENLDKLKNFLMQLVAGDVRFRIIIFVRHPVPWGASFVQQRVKSGSSLDIAREDLFKAIEDLYRSRIEKFLHVFGRESVSVTSFEAAIKHSVGLIGHFFSLVGIPEETVREMKEKRTNERVSAAAIEIMDYINRKKPIIVDGKLNPERKRFDLVPFYQIRGPKFTLSPEEERTIWETSRKAVIWLKDNFGINYSDESSVERQVDQADQRIITEETIEDIVAVYKNLPDVMKEMLFEYVIEKLSGSLR